MKVVYFGDNRNRENWGCRGTSKALADLISINHEIIYTIYGDVSLRHEELFFGKIPQKKHERFLAKIFRYILKKINLYVNGFSDYISDDVDKSLKRFEKISLKHPIYKEFVLKIKECDAVVLNGEGSFIFTTPPRRESIFYLIIFKIAQSIGKKTYCLNAMFSDCPKTGRNIYMLNKTIEVLTNCDCVTAREIESYNYLKEKSYAINLLYVPDALFSWMKYKKYIPLVKTFPNGIIPFPEYDSFWDTIDFQKPYICISGSSSAAWTQEKAIDGYVSLINTIKKLDIQILIVPTCSGDRFLPEVAKRTGVPYLPVATNILSGMSILANAQVFISGRWHPSILASLGGTPCVFMRSNSHKTRSLQVLLEYEKVTEYNDIPTDEDILNIFEDTKSILAEGSKRREIIRTIANKLSDLAIENSKILG